VPPNVEVRLGVTFAELRDLYARASAVVISVHPDGYPHGSDCSGQTVLLDAMAMGCPVVISERAWVHEYVTDGDAALVVPPRDPEALRSAIEKLVHDDTHFAAGLARVFRAVAHDS
jgi:glycosyltransferase involved in cell wall biosynthesis